MKKTTTTILLIGATIAIVAGLAITGSDRLHVDVMSVETGKLVQHYHEWQHEDTNNADKHN